MKISKLLTTIGLIGLSAVIAPTQVLADNVRVNNARVTSIIGYGSYLTAPANGQVFTVYFNQNAAGCAGMWVNAETGRGIRTMELILFAWENGRSVDYEVNTSNRFSDAFCEMRYIVVK